MAESENSQPWQEIARAKRAALADSIPADWRIPQDILPPDAQLDVTSFPRESGFFTDKELEITSAPANALLKEVHARRWTAVEVTHAFCKRAAVAHQLTNCLTDTLFDFALKTAQRLDEHLKTSGKPIGPMHGLPISLKDNFNIRGRDSTIGFVAWAHQPATSNTTLVDLLLSQGAVVYVKTNVPTAMMIPESVNNLFGRTVSPLNRALTSGGSSGGESALIAFGGSVLGVGTDIGGSLRIPAACTGLFTLKPSFGRFPTGGAKSGLVGQETIHSINGPLARSLDEVELFASTVIGAEPWKVDPKCLPIPWRIVEERAKLRIGVLWDDSMVIPTPPVKRALEETVKKLRKAGHEVIDWAPELHKEIINVLGTCFVADGGEAVKKALEPVGEPIRPEMQMYADAKELGVSAMWALQARRTTLMTAYLKRWQSAGIDAILCPTTPYATVRNGTFQHVGYTGVFNVLDYSATSFPSGIMADKSLDLLNRNESAIGDVDAKVRDQYDAAAVHGMPVSLQLVAQRLEEEKVIAMTRTVMKAL